MFSGLHQELRLLRRRVTLTPVRKNGLVTIHLASKLMTLTAQGQAMQDGSKGEIVQVKNIQSKKLIEAVVTHAGKVRVNTPSHLAVN